VAYALIPLQVLQNISNLKESINQVLVKVKESYNVTEVTNDLSEEFRLHGIIVHIYLEGKAVPFIETKSYYNYLVSLISLIGFSIFAISLALIYVSMSLMVTQEYRDLRELRALGANRIVCIIMITLKILVLGLFSALLCAFMIPVALKAFSYYLSSIAPFSASLNLSIGTIFNSALFITSTILPSGLILGIYMANISVTLTLKYE